MSKFKIIKPLPGHRGVQVQDAWLDYQDAVALSKDLMIVVLMITDRGVKRIGGK